MFFEANSLAHFVPRVLNGVITKTIHAMLNIKLYFKGFLSLGAAHIDISATE
jgi:hypothetical protein